MLIIDLETAPQARSLERQPTDDDLNVGVKPNFKPATIDDYRQKNEERFYRRIVKESSLDWRYGQIVCKAEMDLKANPTEGQGQTQTVVRHAFDEDIEPFEIDSRAIGIHWVKPIRCADEGGVIGNLPLGLYRRVVGFNIRQFDLPFLVFRALIHGRQVDPMPKRMGRYDLQGDVIDWMDILAWHGTFPTKGWSLDRYAEWFDFPVQPYGTGADIHGWLIEGDYGSILRHCATDVVVLWYLHQMFEPLIRRPDEWPTDEPSEIASVGPRNT